MSRFSITLQQGVDLVMKILENGKGCEIVIPKIPSFRVGDMAKAIAPNIKPTITGIRPGEKMHEEMITSADSYFTYEMPDSYVILPNNNEVIKKIVEGKPQIKKFEEGKSYSSNTNSHFLSIEELK